MEENIRYYVGLDVHKDSIAIAVAESHSREEPRFIGTTGYSVHQVNKALSSLKCKPEQISIAYEAGPCGYGLQRELSSKGYACIVVAPSRVPRRAADRVKTDRRDALLLARMHRSAELVKIAIPPEFDSLRGDFCL